MADEHPRGAVEPKLDRATRKAIEQAPPRTLPSKADDLKAHLLAHATTVHQRPLAAALLAGVLVGLVNGPLAVLVAGGVAFWIRTRQGLTWALPAVEWMQFAGRLLFAMVFVAPMGTLHMPSARSPDTLAKYVSIALTEPSNLWSAQAATPYPGIPLLVLAAVAAMVLGLRLKTPRQQRMAAAGLGALLVIPFVSGLVLGNPGLHLDLGPGWFLAAIGLALVTLPRRYMAAAFVPLMDPTLLQLPHWAFEATHHGVAVLLVGGVAGLAGGWAAKDARDPRSPVKLTLTYPLGPSKKVLMAGWSFGCRATVDGKEVPSKKVSWHGTASFAHDGDVVRPTFHNVGPNLIELQLKHKGQTYRHTYVIHAKSTQKFARLGDWSYCATSAKGCPACPHPVVGPAIQGSPDVLIDNLPAVRVGDWGVSAADCGPNTWQALEGDPEVTVHGVPLVRIGDATNHAMTPGKMIMGAPGSELADLAQYALDHANDPKKRRKGFPDMTKE